ncbi:topoisomerase II large subunit [Aeromonas phage phiAS5]|uniref:DNA topoisomerase (ATP-hydrolyzing) n=1 Tax=Aeromonas phage phiAS5 TaxID=879630 RepID=E1A2M9_9CAUD|nr:DNA topoisomerase II large subunit [Aeromonas phage phiAS5]ADM79975.1 topoisomerase II large subunit [Aeromonas phage phiAS5]
MSQEFKVLSDKEHCLINTDMYVGSVSTETHDVLIDGKFQPLTYVPGLVKITDEVIDNSVDEAIRTNFEHANVIEITVADNKVSVKDNGRGLPQGTVVTPEGLEVPLPLAAWTRARAGSNFSADRKTIGKNGVGSALTNFFSDSFIGETGNGETVVTVSCTNNADEVSYSVKKGKFKGTVVTFVPDFTRFGVFNLDEDFEQVIKSRLITLAVNFPQVTFKYNGKKVDSKFQKFAAQFGDVVCHNDDNVSVFFGTSEEYRQLSFVNGVHTKQGGNHVYGVLDSLSEELIPMIKRQHKIEINKARIKECLIIGLFIRNLVAPKYDGQTKERLSSPWAQIRDHMNLDYKGLARKILKTPEVIDPIIASALAKKEAADKAAATKAQKKAKAANVAKHVKASGLGRTKTTLFLAEGDSAIGPFIRFRNEESQGGYPLRGKMLNVWNLADHEVLKNKEISDLLGILNVDLRSKEAPAYTNIAIMTDADQDGKGSIAMLAIAFFYKYWPHWFEQGRIHIVRTPEYISTNGKKTDWSYSREEFRSKKFDSKWTHRHIKGLGTLTTEGKNCEYKQCIENLVLEQIVIDEDTPAMLEMLFGDDESKRKTWLGFGEDFDAEIEEEG